MQARGGLNFLTGDAGRFVQNPPANAPATAVDTLGNPPAAAGTAPATAVPVFDIGNSHPHTLRQAVTWTAGGLWQHPNTAAGMR